MAISALSYFRRAALAEEAEEGLIHPLGLVQAAAKFVI